ncbi:hypothetical protein A6R68_10186, partial [Neotoma lepida]
SLCEAEDWGIISLQGQEGLKNFIAIKALGLNTVCNLSTLANFVPCISKMSNLHKIMLGHIFKGRTTTDMRRSLLTMDKVYFLNVYLKLLLRCLKTPLKFLSISLYKFSQSDLDSFAQWSHCQLNHLYLRGVILIDLNFMLLKFPSESVADPLEALELEDCRMKDLSFRVLLPALNQCSWVTNINFYDNDISTNVLKDFLCHTTNLSKMTKEHTAPKEVYNHFDYISVEEFSQCCTDLNNTLITVRQPKSTCFGSNACYDC